jgi:quercetin dioxygenase-like cupin family protein
MRIARSAAPTTKFPKSMFLMERFLTCATALMSAAVMSTSLGCAASSPAAPTPGTGPSAGEPPRARVTTLLAEPLPAPAPTEGRLLTVDYPPGGTTPPHRHDGAIFAYVAEGAVVTALDAGGEQRFDAGQGWFERPGQLHRVSRNASAIQPARIVVVFLTEPGKPVLRMDR